MSNVRYSHLLYHVISPELRDEFFTEGEGKTPDEGWALFEVLYPEEAALAMEILKPMLEEVIKDLKFKRDHTQLLEKGDDLGAARLLICHRASKLEWER